MNTNESLTLTDYAIAAFNTWLNNNKGVSPFRKGRVSYMFGKFYIAEQSRYSDKETFEIVEAPEVRNCAKRAFLGRRPLTHVRGRMFLHEEIK